MSNLTQAVTQVLQGQASITGLYSDRKLTTAEMAAICSLLISGQCPQQFKIAVREQDFSDASMFEQFAKALTHGFCPQHLSFAITFSTISQACLHAFINALPNRRFPKNFTFDLSMNALNQHCELLGQVFKAATEGFVLDLSVNGIDDAGFKKLIQQITLNSKTCPITINLTNNQISDQSLQFLFEQCKARPEIFSNVKMILRSNMITEDGVKSFIKNCQTELGSFPAGFSIDLSMQRGKNSPSHATEQALQRALQINAQAKTLWSDVHRCLVFCSGVQNRSGLPIQPAQTLSPDIMYYICSFVIQGLSDLKLKVNALPSLFQAVKGKKSITSNSSSSQTNDDARKQVSRNC